MTCVRFKCQTECWYCDSPVTRHEHDHAPIPRDVKGEALVTACITCHDLKDRRPLDTWPLELYMAAMGSLSASAFVDSPAVWPAAWDDWPTSARLVWAKWAAMRWRQDRAPDPSIEDGVTGYALLLRV